MNKKKQKKSKPEKKKSGKKITPKKVNSPMAMAMVPFDEIQKVETYKGKLSIVPTPFTGKQIEMLVAPTLPKYVLKRPGKGGKEFSYIPAWYFKKKLNFVFGWMWDFQILGERIDGKFVTVKGKIVVKNAKGQILVEKTDFGGHPIQVLKGGGKEDYVDISNDFKAAASDCLKRCAVQLGIGLDIYSAGDYTNPENPEIPSTGPAIAQYANPEKVSPKTINAVATPAKQVETDYIMRLEDHLTKKGGTTKKQKKDYLAKVCGPMAATRFEQLGSDITQQQAQQLMASIMKGEAEGR